MAFELCYCWLAAVQCFTLNIGKFSRHLQRTMCWLKISHRKIVSTVDSMVGRFSGCTIMLMDRARNIPQFHGNNVERKKSSLKFLHGKNVTKTNTLGDFLQPVLGRRP